MNSETIRQYARFLRNAIQGRMVAILLCHSNLAASILSDNYVIFRKGRVVKKWRKEFPHNNGRISDYLLGNTMTLKKKTLDSYARKVHAGEGVIYGIRNLEIYGEQEDFDFRKGEITTYVISNNAERMKVFLGAVRPDGAGRGGLSGSAAKRCSLRNSSHLSNIRSFLS